MNYIGWINCTNCTITHISDPESVTVWYAMDEAEQLAEVVCAGCGDLVESRINKETLLIFKRQGCAIKSFGDRFEPLTEADIDIWDINAELESFFNE